MVHWAISYLKPTLINRWRVGSFWKLAHLGRFRFLGKVHCRVGRAAQGGEDLLVILWGGKWIFWERIFPGEFGGWGKQYRINWKSEMIIDFRKEGWLTNPYKLCILQFILHFYICFCVIFQKKGFPINSGQM